MFTFNQRTVEEILQMIRVLGGIVGCPEKGHALARELEVGCERIRDAAARLPAVRGSTSKSGTIRSFQGSAGSMLVEIAGGEPVFPELRSGRLARERFVTSEQVIAAAPDIIIGSWCGKAGAAREDRGASRMGSDFLRCGLGSCTRSSPHTFCSRDRRRSPKESRNCSGSWRPGLRERTDAGSGLRRYDPES